MSTSSPATPEHPEATKKPADPDGTDLLAGFDTVLAAVARGDVDAKERSARQHDENETFLSEFATACQQQARPAMEAVVQRLQGNGGGGVIEEHPGGEPRFRNPTLILWMSLEGDIVGEPRPDRNPYLQLEGDVTTHQVLVDEGDMWRGRPGTHCGRIATWQVSEITRDRTIQELLDIAQRSVA
jgi:hypothetical protein